MEKKWIMEADGLQVPCVLTQPDSGDIQRIVLGVHGFGGATSDAIQEGIAEEMGLFRAVTLRFDFPAHGQSPMDSDSLTLENCKASLLAVASYARQQYGHVEDLCIFATGFGAYVTLLCLEELVAMPGRAKLVIKTPSVRMDQTLLSMRNMTEQTLRAVDRVHFAAARPFDATYSFYKELRANPALAEYPIPFLILHGEEDDFIPKADIQQLHKWNEDSKLVYIPGATHQFLEPGAWDMVLDLTRDWFAYEQVLLSDWE